MVLPSKGSWLDPPRPPNPRLCHMMHIRCSRQEDFCVFTSTANLSGNRSEGTFAFKWNWKCPQNQQKVSCYPVRHTLGLKIKQTLPRLQQQLLCMLQYSILWIFSTHDPSFTPGYYFLEIHPATDQETWNGLHTKVPNKKGKVENLTIKRRMKRGLDGSFANSSGLWFGFAFFKFINYKIRKSRYTLLSWNLNSWKQQM